MEIVKNDSNLNLMDVERVSAYLGIPKSTVYAYSMRRKIPHYHVGKLLRFKKDAIDAWLESGGCNGSGLES